MHEMLKDGNLDVIRFTFKMKLKCNRKTCQRTLGTASMYLTRNPRPDKFYMNLKYVDDTFGWLHITAPRRVPFEKQKDPENSYAQAVRYRFTCSAKPFDYFFDDEGEKQLFRERDRKAIERMGCGADHVIKRETLEKAFLEQLGLPVDTNVHKITVPQCWEIEERIAQVRGQLIYLLP